MLGTWSIAPSMPGSDGSAAPRMSLTLRARLRGGVRGLRFDHRGGVVAKCKGRVRLVRDVARLARVGARELALGKNDHAGACRRADHHTPAQLAIAQELQQRPHVHPGRIQLRVHGLGDRELVETIDELGREADDVEDAVTAGDIFVELMQRLLSEHQALRLADPVVHTLERRAFAEEDDAGGIVSEAADVAGVALFLERRYQAREIDERGLQRVIDDLPGRDRNRFAPLLGLWSVLHAAPRLGCFNLLLRYWLLSPLRRRFVCRPRCGCGLTRSISRRRLGRMNELGGSGLDGLLPRPFPLCLALEPPLPPDHPP